MLSKFGHIRIGLGTILFFIMVPPYWKYKKGKVSKLPPPKWSEYVYYILFRWA